MRGKIIGVYGSYGSGLATIWIETDKGVETLHADNGPLFRALDAMFGGVIGPGHTVNPEALKGKEIEFETDDMGLGLIERIEAV